MKTPKIKTIKRLFAWGNVCAFPKCPIPIVDFDSSSITGEIAHIKAKNPKGPRYDVTQTDEERHSFDNLILMCPIHHKVIDDDEETYTVNRLKEMKETQGQKVADKTEPSDEIANKLIQNLSLDVVYEVNISTHNQSGGQTAQTIINIGQSSPSPENRLEATCTHGIRAHYDEQENYYFQLELKNAGSNTISDYRVDIRFPRIFLNESTMFSAEVAERSDSKYKFFRILPQAHGGLPLYTNNKRIVFLVDYIYRGSQSALDEQLFIEIYVDDERVSTVTRPMREFIDD